MQYLIVLIFITVYLISDLSLGYSYVSPFYTHFTYMFQHAGWMHLILNSLAFIGLYRAISIQIKWLFPLILFIGFYCSFLAVHALPTVGASSMVYAMIGMLFGLIKTRRMKIKNLWVFIFSVVLMITVSFFKHSSNTGLHVWSMVFGFGYIMFNKYILRDERQ